MLGVRFHPFGAQPLLKLAMDEIAGATIDLVDLLGAPAREAIERLIGASAPAARFDVVESLLLRLAGSAAPADPLTQAFVGMMTALHGNVPVHQVAARLRVSPRHLNRTLRRHVGLAPKALARILRLQHTLGEVGSGRAATLTDAAYSAGYFDQAHFIRDFQDVCGVSPGAFLGEPHALSDGFR